MYIHSLKNFKTKSIQLGKPEILPPSSDLINRLREINKEQLDTPPTIESEQEIETNHTEKINELKQRRDQIDEKKKTPLQSIPEMENTPSISLSQPIKKQTTPRKPRAAAVKTLKLKNPEKENPS
jgi:hypothetical protein